MSCPKSCTILVFLATAVVTVGTHVRAQAPAATSATVPAQGGEISGQFDSPRATVEAFIQAMNEVLAGHAASYERAIACLDCSKLTPGSEYYAAEELKEVLYRVSEGKLTDQVPDGAEVARRRLTWYCYFPRVPQHQWVRDALKGNPTGRIVLERGTDGRWKFSEGTVSGIDHLYNSVADLRPRYLGEQGQLVSIVGPTFANTPLAHWLMLLLAVLLGVLGGRLVRGLLHALSGRLRRRFNITRATIFDNAAGPVHLALLALSLHIGLGWVYLSPPMLDIAGRAVTLLYIAVVGSFLYNLVEVVELWLRRWAAASQVGRDNMIVPLIRKALRVVVVVVFALVAVQNVFGLNITGFLASVGIAGLAVSLAAQDSIKNLFGSITIFFDRPFAIGDYVKFGDFSGSVEGIGFRSTRLRLDDGSVLAIPNMRFIDNSVVNFAARPSFAREVDIRLALDTTPNQMQQALAIVQGILREPAIATAFDMDKNPPRVFFEKIAPDGLNIKALYWYALKPGTGYWAYLEHAQLFNLKLLRAFEQAGLDFGAPTQTLNLAADGAQLLARASHAPMNPDASATTHLPGAGAGADAAQQRLSTEGAAAQRVLRPPPPAKA